VKSFLKRFDNQTFLTVYSGVLTLGLAVLVLSGFTAVPNSPSFDTITVQRINVVEPDGTLRMVITNNNRIPGVIFEGHEYPDFGGRKATTAAGLLFYDAQATESGGLTFGGLKDSQGVISRFGHLSFDRYNQDEMFTIDAKDDGTNNASVVAMLDQPNWSIGDYLNLRVSIQNLPPDQQQAAINQFFQTHTPGVGVRTTLSSENYPSAPTLSKNGVDLKDSSGKDRVNLEIDSTQTPFLQFLDPNGTVTARYPPN
jgi:hypothetical protein